MFWLKCSLWLECWHGISLGYWSMPSSITLCSSPTHASVRFRLKSFTSCAFSGRLAAPDFVMTCVEVMAVRWPEVWKFIRVFYVIALTDWRQRMMHRMSANAWSHYMVKDIEAIETVQRRFTKQLPGFCSLSYAERLIRINLPNLELRRLHADLIYCYKECLEWPTYRPVTFLRWPLSASPGGTSCSRSVVKRFIERIVIIWNNLPEF